MWLQVIGTVVGLVSASLYIAFKLRVFGGPHCRYNTDMTGKLVIVTGTTSGIGKVTVLRLAQLGASLILLDRNEERSVDTAKLVREAGAKSVETVTCDLSDIKSVREAAQKILKKYDKIDMLINNAGVMACPLTATAQNWEMQYGTNHLGHFALTTLLLPGKARVVCLSSAAHFMAPKCGIDFSKLSYDDCVKSGWFGGRFATWTAYAQSKLANILFAKELQRRYGSQGLTVVSVHPGSVMTNLGRHVFSGFRFDILILLASKPFSKTPEEGAQTQLHCALAPSAELVPGAYYSDCAVSKTLKWALDEELARKLWEVSEVQIRDK